MPYVRRHLASEVDTIASSLTHLGAVSSTSLSCSIVGMLLELDNALLYSAAVHPAYLRSLVCESLYVLWLQSFEPASLFTPSSALGSLHVLSPYFCLLEGSSVTDVAAPVSRREGSDPTQTLNGESVSSIQHSAAASHPASAAAPFTPPLPPSVSSIQHSAAASHPASAAAPFTPPLPPQPPPFPLQPSALVDTTAAISCANREGDAGDVNSLRYVATASHPTSAIGGDTRPECSASASAPHVPPQMSASAAGPTSTRPDVGAWADEAFVRSLIVALRSPHLRRRNARSAALYAELDRSVRDIVVAASPSPPLLSCLDRLRSVGAHLAVPATHVDAAVAILADRLRAYGPSTEHAATLAFSSAQPPPSSAGTAIPASGGNPDCGCPDAGGSHLVTSGGGSPAEIFSSTFAPRSSLLPPPSAFPPVSARAFFVGGGKPEGKAETMDALSPVGRYSTCLEHQNMNLSSHDPSLQPPDSLLSINAKSFVVLSLSAKSIWIGGSHGDTDVMNASAGELVSINKRRSISAPSYSRGHVPEGYEYSNEAITKLSRARRQGHEIRWKGILYPQRVLGVWRRMFCTWRARITGWFTSAEFILYYSLVIKIEKGAPGARKLLAELVHRTRYKNGRLPGCSRYCECKIKSHYKWSARAKHCVHTRFARAYGYPLEYYGFTASTHEHGSILRLRSVPVWCYFRHKSEARCMFGLRETATQQHRIDQQARIEERALYFGLYRLGYALKYGNPVQVHKGCLPGGFTKGASTAGFEVAGIDISAKSEDFCREFRPSKSSTRVTFTLGDALDDSVVAMALQKHPGLQHTSTFSAYNCQPHSSVNQLRKEQGADSTGRILNTALGVDRRAYHRHGITWFQESVVGSVSDVDPQFKYVIITGFLTGESSIDKHAIYYEDGCEPLLDKELLEHAAWLSNHSCGGMLRPFQHLGPDGVPTFMGERDPSDPSRWVHYVKKSGGWVNRRPWACCEGNAFIVVGNMPPGVSHRDWCNATGNSPDHIRDTQQLRNALWPRLGLLLAPQLQMYWMANTFGFPVIDFPEARSDPQLLAWLRSILLCKGPWPRMPFTHHYLVLTPVSDPGTIIVTAWGHLLGVHIPTRTSTLHSDLISALSFAYPQLSLDAKDLRFAGMLDVFTPSYLVFCSEVIDDDARSKIPAYSSELFSSSTSLSLISISISDYLAFLNNMARLGRWEWGLDLVILRSHLRSATCEAQGLSSFATADKGVAAHVQIEWGRYLSFPSVSSPLRYTFRSQPTRPDARKSFTFRAFGSRAASSRPPQLSFEDYLEFLCPSASDTPPWVAQRSVVNSKGSTVLVPCAARVLTRALAREIMPELVPTDPPAPAALADNHFHNTFFDIWSARYEAAAKRLGLNSERLVNLGNGAYDEHDPQRDPEGRKYFPLAHAVCCLPTQGSSVLVFARGGRLVLLSERVTRISRSAVRSSIAVRAHLLLQHYGRLWTRVPSAPSCPLLYSELKQHYLSARSGGVRGRPGHLVHNHPLFNHAGSQLARNPDVPLFTVTRSQLQRFLPGLHLGPFHYIRVPAPVQRRRDSRLPKESELIFQAGVRHSDASRLKLPCVTALETTLGSLRHAIDMVVPCRGVHELGAAWPPACVLEVFLDWLVARDVSISRLGSISLHFNACVADCSSAPMCHHHSSISSASGRLLQMHVAQAALRKPQAHLHIPIRVDSAGYDIRTTAYVVPLHGTPRVSAPLVDSAGVIQRRLLQDESLYLCPSSVLSAHMASTGRPHLAALVASAINVSCAQVATASAPSPVHQLGVHLSCSVQQRSHVRVNLRVLVITITALSIEDVLGHLIGYLTSCGDHTSSVTISSCSHGFRTACPSMWQTHLDYARTPYVDLACDWRVMSALHSGDKSVETRFARGPLSRVRAGFICRMWCPRPSVTCPASKFPCYRYISGVVFDRSFQRLYERFGPSVLPGLPQDYISSHRAHSSTRAGDWHPSDIEAVYMSIYYAHHSTVESWRASQRRTARNVVGFILSPLPPGFIPPSGPPFNPRVQVPVHEPLWLSLGPTVHASVVVQCYVRRYLLRSYLGRLSQFYHITYRTALLAGRDVVVPWSLHVTYGRLIWWAPYRRPRLVGYVAALRLQTRWRRWLSTPSSCSSPADSDFELDCELFELELDILHERRRVELSCAAERANVTVESSRLVATVVNDLVSAVILQRMRSLLVLFIDTRPRRPAEPALEPVLSRLDDKLALLAPSVARHALRSRSRLLWCVTRAAWALVCLLVRARHRCLRKVTRTGRSYALSERATASFTFPGSPEFTIDDLALHASAVLHPRGLRVAPTSRDGACLFGAILPRISSLAQPSTSGSTLRVFVADTMLSSRTDYMAYVSAVARSAASTSLDGDDILISRAVSCGVSRPDVSAVRLHVSLWLCARVRHDSTFASQFASCLIADFDDEIAALEFPSSYRYGHLRDVASALAVAPSDPALLSSFCDAYSEYIRRPDTYCGSFEIVALAHVLCLCISVLRVASGDRASLSGATVERYFSCSPTNALASATVLYTNSHYDAVVVRHSWCAVRALGFMVVLFRAVRRARAVLFLEAAPSPWPCVLVSSSGVMSLASPAPAPALQPDSFLVGGGAAAAAAALTTINEERDLQSAIALSERESHHLRGKTREQRRKERQIAAARSALTLSKEMDSARIRAHRARATNGAEHKPRISQHEAACLIQSRYRQRRLFTPHQCMPSRSRSQYDEVASQQHGTSAESEDQQRTTLITAIKLQRAIRSWLHQRPSQRARHISEGQPATCVEMFCVKCGDGGVINDEGICDACSCTPSPASTSITGAFLTYSAGSSCS